MMFSSEEEGLSPSKTEEQVSLLLFVFLFGILIAFFNALLSTPAFSRILQFTLGIFTADTDISAVAPALASI